MFLWRLTGDAFYDMVIIIVVYTSYPDSINVQVWLLVSSSCDAHLIHSLCELSIHHLSIYHSIAQFMFSGSRVSPRLLVIFSNIVLLYITPHISLAVELALGVVSLVNQCSTLRHLISENCKRLPSSSTNSLYSVHSCHKTLSLIKSPTL